MLPGLAADELKLAGVSGLPGAGGSARRHEDVSRTLPPKPSLASPASSPKGHSVWILRVHSLETLRYRLPGSCRHSYNAWPLEGKGWRLGTRGTEKAQCKPPGVSSGSAIGAERQTRASRA